MKGCFLCLYQCVLPDRCTHAEIRSDMAFPVGGGGGGGRGYRPAWGVDEVAEIASSCRRVGLECCCCCSLPPQQPCPVGVSPFTKALSEKRVAERALWHTGQDPSIYKRHLHSLVTNLDYTHTHTHTCAHSAYAHVWHHASANVVLSTIFVGVCVWFLELSSNTNIGSRRREQSAICPVHGLSGFLCPFPTRKTSTFIANQGKEKKRDRVAHCLSKF